MKTSKIGFHGGAVFLMPERRKRIGSGRRRLERNPFLEPQPSLLGTSESDLNRWKAAAGKFLKEAFKDATERIGEEAARKLFANAAPLRRGRRKGQRNAVLYPDVDARLLSVYDERAALINDAAGLRSLPHRLAVELYADGKGTGYGANATAIEWHIRRALRKRLAERKKIREQSDALRAVYREEFGKDFSDGTLLTPAMDSK
jgi:hypothetical protein